MEEMIIARDVVGSRKLKVLPIYFKKNFSETESIIYTWARTLSNDYKGDLWTFVELSNDGFFMFPGTDAQYQVNCPGNFFSGSLSATAFGITACLYAYNQMTWKYQSDHFERLYYSLRRFAIQHAEAAAIMGAID